MHHAAKISSFLILLLFCFPSTLGEKKKKNNMVLPRISSIGGANNPLHILGKIIAPLCARQ